MNSKIIRTLCLVLSVFLGLGLMSGLAPAASAAATTHQLAVLVKAMLRYGDAAAAYVN